ncbi:MAG TPA: haloacid dehalogenase-like hydrolase [Gemmatimonadaceae bacterium]|nr:haloacid dehalogenase-like hydrolase [Gemmatimonadaceae bacterium]
MRSDPGEREEPPLCVDLDGTLVATDTLRVSLGLLARRRPWLLLPAAACVVGGRAAFKAYVATCILPDAATLPWRTTVVDFLRAERARGRRLILATAADHRIAACAAQHLGIFDAVIATEGGDNRKGAAKLAAIRNLLGDKEFDYIGDSLDDLPLFHAARKVFLVAPGGALLDRVRRGRTVDRVFPD